ncbi:hypothetical protein [Tychonema sp. LEGE 06208]|uniref:hypothetical protein n=1 Tax=Tychonema sp. LEGE 06208 TaxID=1828663 RepID=UPI001880DCC6|nr:hypothetical protein [Tychonema sp. LEGE 06208]MBE9161638.1 hypothetical protein [Tychonema sp. LEGE 06208]
MKYREKHYCDKFDCPHPPKLACNQFCTSCSKTIGPHRSSELKSEFVQVTKKELALQERLPPRSKLNLTYGYLPSRGQSTPDDYWSKPSYTWPAPAPKQNNREPVLGYYKYTSLHKNC